LEWEEVDDSVDLEWEVDVVLDFMVELWAELDEVLQWLWQ
jgi:hypothetical protein